MSMIELNTIDPMIALAEERAYLMARVHALEQIILDQTKFDADVEFARFCKYAKVAMPEQLARGWNIDAERFNHGNLHKRWLGWCECAKARQVTR